jgi:RNase P subunit RPR2
MARMTKGRVVTLGPERRPFNCLACGGALFRYREATVGGDAFGDSATALICLACGYVQMFVDGMAELWDPPG